MVVKKKWFPPSLSSGRCRHHTNPPENEITKLLSTTKKHGIEVGVVVGGACNTLRAALMVVTTNPKFQGLHRPRVSIHSGPRENSRDPGGQRLFPGQGYPGSIYGKRTEITSRESFRAKPASDLMFHRPELAA